jgi:hypothetical protein
METIEVLNRRLIDYWGCFLDGQPNYRIVWSEDQFEKRLSYHTDLGFELLTPEVRELPKYRHYIRDKYILEKLIEVPIVNKDELVKSLTYEPLWVFEDKFGNPLPPDWGAIRVILGSVHEAAAKAVGVKYKDPALEEADPKIGWEVRDARLKEVERSLFGNENNVTDALAYREGIVVPAPMQKENSHE